MVHVSPTAKRKRGRLAAGAVLMAMVPLVAGVWYFGYNVGAVTVLVTDDAIGDFSSLEVTFTDVAVHSTGALTSTSWVSLGLQETSIDLTKLTDNRTSLVGLDSVPAGKYTQARILVSSAVGQLENGGRVSVAVPSGELRTTNPFEIGPQGSITIIMRVHVVATGSYYQLEPVLGTVLEG